MNKKCYPEKYQHSKLGWQAHDTIERHTMWMKPSEGSFLEGTLGKFCVIFGDFHSWKGNAQS